MPSGPNGSDPGLPAEITQPLVITTPQPLDVILLILDADPTTYGRLKVTRGFAALSSYARRIVLDLCFPTLILSGQQAFMLADHLRHLSSSALSPFHYTTVLRLLYDVTHCLPLIHFASSMRRVRTLDFRFNTVRDQPLDHPVAISFSAALHHLRLLAPCTSLRHILINLFIDHAHRQRRLDISGLAALAACESLTDLTFAIAGGAQVVLPHSPILALPPALERMTISVQVLAILAPASWAPPITALEVVEWRNNRQLPGDWHYTAMPSAQLAAGLASALPLAPRLVCLKLSRVYIHPKGVMAISQFALLTRLDFHPALYQDSDYAERLKKDTTPRLNALNTLSDAYLYHTGVGPASDKLSSPSAHELRELHAPLCYLLSKLDRLAVLHLGGSPVRFQPPALVPPNVLHERFNETLDAVAPFIPRALRFIHLGHPHKIVRGAYVHLPTCTLCSSVPGLTRRPDCAAFESELLLAAPDWQHSSCSDPLTVSRQKRPWDCIFDYLYLSALSELPRFAHDPDELPGYYHFVALDDLAQSCKSIRGHCLRRLYSSVRLSVTQTVLSIAALQPVLYFPYTSRDDLPRTSLATARPFANTISLDFHVSPQSHAAEHLSVLSFTMPALLHVYVRVLFREDDARDILQYQHVLRHVNRYLSSDAGRQLYTFGLWFVRSPAHRPPLRALLQHIPQWDPILVGPRLTNLHLFADLYPPGLPDHAASPPTPLRFFPWPCHVRQLAIEASDFFLADPINWLSQRALHRVRIVETLPNAYYDPVLALQLARAILSAVPAWAAGLTTLQLVHIHFDRNVALALAQLASLQQLDLHPVSLDARVADRVFDDGNENLALADQRLQAHQQWHIAGLHPHHRIVLVPDDLGTAQTLEFDHLTSLITEDFFTLLKLSIPSLPLRIMHIGSRHACVLAPRDDFLHHDALAHQPIEVWHHIVHFAGDQSARSSLARRLSAVSPGVRTFFIRLSFPSLTLYGDQAYMFNIFLTRGLPTTTAFAYTATLVLAAQPDDIASLCSAAAECLPNLASLTCLCPDIQAVRPSRQLAALSASFQHFAGLARRRRLRHFALHLHLSHPFNKTHTLDLSELDFLTCLHVESLTLDVTGGLSFSTDEPILLPGSLMRVRVTPAILGLIQRATWSHAEQLVVVHIEDTRTRSQLKSRSDSLAAAALTSALAPAISGWAGRLRVLRLFAVFLDYPAILLLGELTLLQRLDLQPMSLFLAAHEISLLQSKAILRNPPVVASRAAQSLSGLGPFAGFVDVFAGLPDLLPLLKYLICRLSNLHTLRVGHRSPRLRDVLGSPEELQTEHLFLYKALCPYLHPSLSLWSFAHTAGNEPLLHLPTCGLCSHLPPGSRSTACRQLETLEVLRNRQADQPDEIPAADIPCALKVHEHVTTVGPLL
ncbi:hypothetical protein AURDEDRAFT_131234 [Auricularia subglabra TFB-10046 SS5]|uniref:Uncharacterized protein n=1 Tax=Auricularia subglabra (strain TFB-10046 / SS5) TaxID=717982 RepID=J0WQX3_AURST|nr:hypothetical protein AURDEDRAFT_131234 [Auricularia subglabra TFB-10046 SS5]